MDELKMIRSIAYLEGLSFVSLHGMPLINDNGRFRPYDPLYDHRINRKLILKYKVRLIKYHRSVTITQENGGFGLKCIRATYRTDDDLPYAVVECILKANGLWVTNNK